MLGGLGKGGNCVLTADCGEVLCKVGSGGIVCRQQIVLGDWLKGERGNFV